MALVKAIAAGQQPVNLVKFNDTALNKKASTDQNSFKVPGVKLNYKKDMQPTGRK